MQSGSIPGGVFVNGYPDEEKSGEPCRLPFHILFKAIMKGGNNMAEIWKDIDGFEGIYKISNEGRVKSFYRCESDKGRIITQKKNTKGYMWVILYKNGTRKCALVHRLVAEAFIPIIEGCKYVNHKDENPLNNKVENLEWCTASYNVKYSIDRHPERKTNHANGKRRNRRKGFPYKHKSKVVQIDSKLNEVKIWDNIVQVCAKYNWHSSSIRECCLGKRKTAYGFTWRFAD